MLNSNRKPEASRMSDFSYQVLTRTCHEKSISAYLPVPELVNIDIKIGQEYIRCVKQNKKIRP
jgi:hypothetical protein